MLKCAANDDVITMKAEENSDVVTFLFESAGGACLGQEQPELAGWVVGHVPAGRARHWGGLLPPCFGAARGRAAGARPAHPPSLQPSSSATHSTPRLLCLPACQPALPAGQGRVSEFELKLMDITSENLGIPDTEYSATVGGWVGGGGVVVVVGSWAGCCAGAARTTCVRVWVGRAGGVGGACLCV